VSRRDRLRQRIADLRAGSASAEPEPPPVPPSAPAPDVPAVPPSAPAAEETSGPSPEQLAAARDQEAAAAEAPAVAALVEALETRGQPTLTQATVRVCLIVIAAVASVYFLYLIRDIIVLVFIAGFLAVALGPPVDWMHRRHVPRALAILTTYLAILAGIVGVGLLVVPPVVNGVDELANDLPHYIDELRDNRTVRDFDEKYHVSDKLKEQAETLPNKIGDAASALQDVTVGVFSTATDLIAVLTIAFFLLLDGRRLLELFSRIRGPNHERRLRRIARDVYKSTSGYVAGNLIISACAGITTFVTLEILGVPFAAPLAVLMALLDLVPLVGATIAGIIIAAVTAFNDFPTATIVWVIVLVVYQQIENSVLQPVVYRKTVDVSPLITILAVLVGATVLGILGALLAIPVAAAIQIVLRDLAAERTAARRA
jgi:predicted PurR-regulated permease PerM